MVIDEEVEKTIKQKDISGMGTIKENTPPKPFQVTKEDFDGTFITTVTNNVTAKFEEYLGEIKNSIPFSDLSEQLFLFTDIETDGFNVSYSGLLEIFSSICAFNKRTKTFIRFADIHVVYQLMRDRKLSDFDEWSLINHSKSGLLSDCIEYGVPITRAYPDIVTLMVKRLVELSKEETDNVFQFSNKVVLAGSGVHYDYKWITGIFTESCKDKVTGEFFTSQISKEFKDILHYRLMDTTTFLLTKKLLGGDISKPKPEEILSSEELNNIASVEHRARYDTLQSIKLMENHIKDCGFSNSIIGD